MGDDPRSAPKLVGAPTDGFHSGFWRRSIDVVKALDDLQAETAVLGVISLVALFALRRLAPGLPGPLFVLAASLVAVAVFQLGDEGVSVVGEPDGALFDFGFPSGLEFAQYVDLIPGALAIVVLGFTESMGAAKAAALKTGERLDPNQELLAVGASNLGAGISGGYVVAGALSKTSVAIASGGRSQVGNLFAGLLGVVTIIVLRPLFESLALAVLAAIVVFAMSGMIDVSYFRLLWQLSRVEFLVALVAFLGVLSFGVLQGVVVAVVLSLALLVRAIGDPPSSVLGRTPSGSWTAVDEREDALQLHGMLVWRQEAPLVFVNARRLSDRVRALVTDDLEVLVLDSSVVSGVDTTGLSAFMGLVSELRESGIEVWVVHPLARTWARAEQQVTAAGNELPRLFESLDGAVSAFENRGTRR